MRGPSRPDRRYVSPLRRSRAAPASDVYAALGAAAPHDAAAPGRPTGTTRAAGPDAHGPATTRRRAGFASGPAAVLCALLGAGIVPPTTASARVTPSAPTVAADATQATRAARQTIAARTSTSTQATASVLGAPAVRCPFADATPRAVGTVRAAAALACLLEHERAAAGLPRLHAEPRLRVAAARHARDMGRRIFFGSLAPPPAPFGATTAERVAATGYAAASTGELVARGQETPRDVVRAWLETTGPCEAATSTRHTEAGTAVAVVAGEPYWVRDQALPGGAPPPTPPGAEVACPRLPAVPAPSGRVPATRATARRTGRRLAISVTVPRELGRATLELRITQTGRGVRTHRRRFGPGEHRLALRIGAARAGRLVVRLPPNPTVTVRFR